MCRVIRPRQGLLPPLFQCLQEILHREASKKTAELTAQQLKLRYPPTSSLYCMWKYSLTERTSRHHMHVTLLSRVFHIELWGIQYSLFIIYSLFLLHQAFLFLEKFRPGKLETYYQIGMSLGMHGVFSWGVLKLTHKKKTWNVSGVVRVKYLT